MPTESCNLYLYLYLPLFVHRSKRGATLPPLDFTQPGQAAAQQQQLAAPLAYTLRGKQLATLLPASICQVCGWGVAEPHDCVFPL
jgi:hypothetical protein